VNDQVKYLGRVILFESYYPNMQHVPQPLKRSVIKMPKWRQKQRKIPFIQFLWAELTAYAVISELNTYSKIGWSDVTVIYISTSLHRRASFVLWEVNRWRFVTLFK